MSDEIHDRVAREIQGIARTPMGASHDPDSLTKIAEILRQEYGHVEEYVEPPPPDEEEKELRRRQATPFSQLNISEEAKQMLEMHLGNSEAKERELVEKTVMPDSAQASVFSGNDDMNIVPSHPTVGIGTPVIITMLKAKLAKAREALDRLGALPELVEEQVEYRKIIHRDDYDFIRKVRKEIGDGQKD